MSQGDSSSTQATASPEDDWSSVQDPNERRRIQNRIAQRKFREKVRQQKEETDRNAENQRRAAGSYSTPEAEDLDTNEEGLPWGSISLRHVVTTGRNKEQSSRETSLYAAASKAGGSSRLGLHLIDNYARGSPAWAAWKARFAPFFMQAAEGLQDHRAWSLGERGPITISFEFEWALERLEIVQRESYGLEIRE